MTTINKFVANFEGGARPNLFRVDLNFAGSEMEFMCKAAQIPGRTINPIEVRYLNNVLKVAGDTTFQDWQVTIINDQSYSIRNAIQDKMAEIKANGGTEGATGLSYFTEAFVTQLDQNGDDKHVYKLFNLFPSDLSSVELGFDTTDTVEEYTVSFAYSHWEKIS